MSGISNLNPPKPKYCFTWDVETVLNYIRNLPDNSALSIKQLTLKVTMLLALIAINRGSELKLLNLNYLSKYSSRYSFAVRHTVKHSKEGKIPPPMVFYKFQEDARVCPVTTINSYIDRTKSWRVKTNKEDKETQLFLGQMNWENPISYLNFVKKRI